ncbi:hypothetical protein Verru16b_01219 [Lacunisphaera limnophila]|uniref:Peptidase family M50 n=1 Tax=Lacunisphaera limnophila TaxID=1838286 RepID=A0A1D8ATC9_9BACT|nr:hypothetical protein Verru16b_01219 [Lacunisphaera limnophila]
MRKFTWRQVAVTGALALVGAALGFFAARDGAGLLLPLPHKLHKLIPLAALPLVWLVVVGFHELGHLVGGWLTGGRFLLWVVGPGMIRRTPAGLKVAWNRNVNLAGGMAACLPLEPGRMTPRRAAVMILGGPVFSLVLVVAALGLAAGLVSLPEPVPLGRALAQHLAMSTAGLSLLIFGVTAFPGTAGGFKTDGKRVIDLLRGDHRSDQEAALLTLSTAGLAGVRPADYDPVVVARTVALGDGSLFDLYGHLTVYYHAADRGDWAAAQGHLDRVLAGEEKLVPFMRDTVRSEYAWLLATVGGVEAAGWARAWLDTAGRLDFDPATRLRAEAAVLAAEGKAAEAAAKAREGLHALEHRSLSPVKNQFAAEALAAIRDRAATG